MTRFFLLFFLSLISLLATDKLYNKKNFIEPFSGIPIYWKAKGNFYPSSWLDPPISGTAVSLEKTQLQRGIDLVSKAIEKYDKDILAKNLKKIYLFKNINFYGVNYGGTNSNDAVYMTIQANHSGYTDTYIESTFHHELSSIFLRNYPSCFKKKSWLKVNGKDFEYGKGGMEAIKAGEVSFQYEAKYHERGFLNQYGVSALEEDFNTFSQDYMMGEEKLTKAAQKYPLVRKKLNLIKKFYRCLK
jgi:hypothetical protein